MRRNCSGRYCWIFGTSRKVDVVGDNMCQDFGPSTIAMLSFHSSRNVHSIVSMDWFLWTPLDISGPTLTPNGSYSLPFGDWKDVSNF